MENKNLTLPNINMEQTLLPILNPGYINHHVDLKDEPIDEDVDHSTSPMDELAQLPVFKCSVCTFETENETKFIIHKKVHRTTYRCDSCLYKCGHKHKLLDHKRKKHCDLEDLLYFCGDCDFKSINKLAFKKHRRELHKKSWTGKLSCDHCSYKTDYSRKLTNHIKTHLTLEERMLYCSECDFKTVIQGKMVLHKRESHSEQFFKCDICMRTFVDGKEFQEHMDRHNWPMKDGRYLCKLCDYSSMLKSTILAHTKVVHEGKKKGVMTKNCDECPYRTDKLWRLERHKMCHINADSRLRCRDCTYLAFSTQTLAKHQKFHAGPKT